MPQAALISGPGVETPRRFAQGALLLGFGDRRGNRDGYRFGNLVLYREDVGEVAVVALGPDVFSTLGVDELRGDPNAIAGFTQAAFEDIADAKLVPDLLHINRAAFVGEGRVAGDHE